VDRGAASPHGTSTLGVEVRRSARRRRTVSAFRENGRLVVAIPARFTRAEEEHWVARMVERIEASDRRRRPSDSDLTRRADRLAATYLPPGVRPSSITWVTNQSTRWGSCTPSERSIRLSHRLQGMPSWVIDYVVLHELAHLVVPGHGPQFWEIVDRFPHTERARGFLHGVAFRDAEGSANPSDIEGFEDDAE
jgi:predicted metal-dependent hydrolase